MESFMRRMLFGTLVAFMMAAAVTSAAGARNTNTATIALAGPTAPLGAWPNLGDWVSFTVTFPKQLESKNVRIQVACYQNGNLVYADAQTYTASFELGGSASQWWSNGGGATCVADLYYWGGNGSFNWLATTQFTAGS